MVILIQYNLLHVNVILLLSINITFNIPDFSGKVLQGADSSYAVGTTIEAGLPNIEGNVYSTLTSVERHTTNASGCLKYNEYYDVGIQLNDTSVVKCYSLDLDASLYNSIYGKSTTVQPPAVSTNFCIKY